MALKKEITQQIRELLRQNPGGLSITAIVRQVPVNRNTAGRYLENLMLSGQVEMRHFGMAKIYSLAQRVPLSAMLSISSQLIMLLDGSRRVHYANNPMLDFLDVTQRGLYGKAIEFTPFLNIFDEAADMLRKKIQGGVAGKEWSGEITAGSGHAIFTCRIAPAVFEEGQRGVSILLENITERRASEQRIRESERQFRLLTENTRDVISLTSDDGTCLYVSPAIQNISGFDPREVTGRNASDFLHPDDLPRMRRSIQNLTRHRPSVTILCRCRHKDGTYVWAESSFQAMFDNVTGEKTEIYGVTRDVTDRILAEQELRESEDRYRTLVEISPDAIILHQDGRIIYMNPAAQALLGVTSISELPSPQIIDIVHPDYRQVVVDNIKKDLQGEASPLVELQVIRADGTTLLVEGRGAKTRIAGKSAIQVTLHDITERKKTEDAIRESEGKYRDLVEQSLQGLTIVQDGRVVYANPAILAITGYSLEEILSLGQDGMLANVHPLDLDRIQRAFKKRLGRKELFTSNELRMFRKDGALRWVLTYSTLITYQGAPAIQSTYLDITERKNAERALQESEEKYRCLVEQSLQGLTIIQDGRPVYANPAMLEISGYALQEYLALTAGEMLATIHPLDRDRIRKVMEKRLKSQKIPVENEFRIFRKDGSVRWVLTHGTLVTYHGAPAIQIAYMDITERKRAEDALWESQRRLVASQRMARLGDIVWDLETGEITWSKGIYDLMQYDPSEKIDIKKVNAEIHHPEDLERITKWLNDCITSGSNVITPNEYRIIRKDGKIIFVHTLGEIQHVHGKPAKVFLTLQDITERKRSEETLRESEATARALINAPTDRIILTDNQGQILDLNEAAAQGLGKTRNEILGAFPSEVLPSKSFAARMPRMGEVIATGKAVRFMDERNGVWFDNIIYPIFGPQGDVIRLAIVARDVTWQKAAEAALRESEMRYRSLAEASQDLIFVIGRDDTVEYVNSYAASILGIPAEQIIGRKRSSLFTGELGERQAQRLRRIFETGIPGRSEGAMEAFGIRHWFDHFLMPLADADGNVTAVLGVSRDISERRRAEEALSESEERFHDLADMLPQCVWECDCEGRLSFVSRSGLEMYGYTADDIRKGLTIWQTIHPDDRDRAIGLYRDSLNLPPSEFLTHHEFRALKKDGVPFTVLIYHVPVIRNNRIEGMRGIAIDLTERLQIEDSLRQSVQTFRALAENSVDIISRIRPDGTCAYVSPAVRESLGYEPEEVTGVNGFEYLHPDDLPHVLAMVSSFADNGADTATDRFRMRHKDGSYIWFDATIRAIRDRSTGRIAEFTMVSRNAGKAGMAGKAGGDQEP